MTEFVIEDKDLAGLKGKVVIVTGGSSGIGLATVATLLSLGASVVNADINPPAEQPESSYTFVKTDVTVWADQVALFKKAKEIHGRVDHVFANAGVGPRANYLSTDVDENGDLVEPTHALLDVSLKGVMHTATLAIYHMRQQAEGGSIVINGSSTGLQRLRAVDYGESQYLRGPCLSVLLLTDWLILQPPLNMPFSATVAVSSRSSRRPRSRSESTLSRRPGPTAMYSRT